MISREAFLQIASEQMAALMAGPASLCDMAVISCDDPYNLEVGADRKIYAKCARVLAEALCAECGIAVEPMR